MTGNNVTVAAVPELQELSLMATFVGVVKVTVPAVAEPPQPLHWLLHCEFVMVNETLVIAPTSALTQSYTWTVQLYALISIPSKVDSGDSGIKLPDKAGLLVVKLQMLGMTAVAD